MRFRPFFKGRKGATFTVPIELESGDVDASKVIVQLQAALVTCFREAGLCCKEDG